MGFEGDGVMYERRMAASPWSAIVAHMNMLPRGFWRRRRESPPRPLSASSWPNCLTIWLIAFRRGPAEN